LYKSESANFEKISRVVHLFEDISAQPPRESLEYSYEDVNEVGVLKDNTST